MSDKIEKCNEPGNYDGDCCCNCIYQLKLMCHPHNGEKLVPMWDNCPPEFYKPDRFKFGKGNVTQQCGWVCSVSNHIDKDGSVGFSDTEHGICEMHTPKKA